MTRNRLTLLWRLFADMFRIALCVVGGGFAILAVADDVFARRRGWTKPGEIIAQLPVFQMVPGVIAGNTAVYVGNKMAGPLGAAIALAGTLLPSILVFTGVTLCYHGIPVAHPLLAAAFAGLRAALAGVIAAMLVQTWRTSVRGVYGYAALAAATFLIGARILPAACVIGAAAVLGVSGACLARLRIPRDRVRGGFWMIPLVFLKYGLVAFGGGYVLVPLYVADFVGPAAPYLQLAANEFADIMALTQMTPGPISVNCATFFGFRMGGFAGAVAATVALVLPGYVLLLILLRSLDRFREHPVTVGLLKGIRPVTAALMLVAGWTFLGMSAWRTEPSGLVFDGVAAGLVVFTAVAHRRRWLGVVKLVAGSALVSVLARGATLLSGTVF